MANEHKDYVSHADFTVEDKVKIEEDVRRFPKAEVFWDKFCDHKPWVRGAKKFSYRKLIKPTVTTNDKTPLVEGVGARPSTLELAEFEGQVNNYGSYIPYTKEAVQFNFDDTLSMITDAISYKSVAVPEALKAAEFASSRNQLTAASTIIATLGKAKAIFRKFKVKPQANGKYVAIIDPMLTPTLLAEIGAVSTLPESTKNELNIDGFVANFQGWTIIERYEDAMQGSTTSGQATYGKTCMILLGKSEEGLNSVTVTGQNTEIILNPLGSGVIKDASGNVVADTNKRVGSVAYNIDALGIGTQADDARMICWFATTDATSALANTKTYGDVTKDAAYKSGTDTTVPLNLA